MPFDHQHAWGKVKPIQIKTWLNLKKFKYFHIFARFADMQNEKKCLKIASCLKTTLCWAKNIWISRFYPHSLTTTRVLSVGSTVNVFWCFLLRSLQPVPSQMALQCWPAVFAFVFVFVWECTLLMICAVATVHTSGRLLEPASCSSCSCCSCVRVLLQY